MPTTGEISLYFHIPFCLKKCPYCHFYSVYPEQKLVEKYQSCLLAHLDQTVLNENQNKSQNEKPKIVSIYFGGGTPALLPAAFFETLLTKISHKIKISKNCEITIEANPFQMTKEKFLDLRKTGINRLSLGVQSFDDELLKILQRSHSAQEAEKNIYLAQEAGFENISIDLMYDIPTQTEEQFIQSVFKAVKLPITHISLYNLIFEKKTPFFKSQARLKKLILNEKAALKSFQKAKTLFSKAGFKRYEISAFAKKGCASKHNLGYWTGRPFLGFGPSAFSYANKSRFQNCSSVNEYCRLIQVQNIKTEKEAKKENKGTKIEKELVSYSEKLAYPDNIRELLAINLRILKGIDLKDFEQKNGLLDIETLKRLEKLKQQRLLVLDTKKQKLKLTAKGTLFYDLVAEEII